MDDAYAEMSVLIQECQRDAFSLDASFQVCIFPRESSSTGRSEYQTGLVFLRMAGQSVDNLPCSTTTSLDENFEFLKYFD